MATMPVERQHGEYTVEDLASFPDDGKQYELIDGILLVSPAPAKRHQFAAFELASRLRSACPPDLLTMIAPLDWRPDGTTSLQPDVLVVRRERLDDQNITETPLLVVEVLSPSTRGKDLLYKRERYERAGIPSYWVLDPAAESLLVLELHEGAYRTLIEVKGEDRADLSQPFPVTLSPADLSRL